MIAALDYGDRYIGVAITDHDERLALRYAVIDQKSHDYHDAIQKLIDKEKVTKIVVGVPISLDGTETDQTHRSLAFIEELRQKLDDAIEVEGADETLTTVEAEKTLEQEGGDPIEVHAEAARLILQDYLRATS